MTMMSTNRAYVVEYDAGIKVYTTDLMDPASAEYYAMQLNQEDGPTYAVVQYLQH